MNPFETATNDIFDLTDFTSTATIGGSAVTVIKSAVTEQERLTAFGLDEGVGFYLRCKTADLDTAPKRNDLITVDSVTYRVSAVTIDSAGQTYRIDLKSKSSR